ncbi:MAG: PSD1 and planctomycete cytochrome C domain-containing protein [Verrucomicrobiales bacterium]
MRKRHFPILLPLALAAPAFAAPADPPAAAAVDFERDVIPIFADRCTSCHGEDKQKGALRLDSAAGIAKGGDSGEPVFLAGDAAKSHLIALVESEDLDERMPPKGKPLTAAQIGVLRAWIDAGAALPGIEGGPELTTDHWSFQPLAKIEPPPAAPTSSQHPVDRFLAQKLAEKGLSPSPRADRSTLIRRLYLVMLGLPPTPEEVRAFAADDRADAWEHLVDRVLKSPHYGERWARHWLDVARFAETDGYETNRERPTAYHFRDYVIEAFNDDKPYNQFIEEQIAGDALGDPVGTGFLVGGPRDIVKSPDINLTLMQRQDEMADMINTTGTAFLGLTLGCARCHNHKFDPVSQKDYYSMQAIFAGVNHGERNLPPDPESAEKIAALDTLIAGLEKRLEKFLPTGALRPPVNARENVELIEPTAAKFVRFTIKATNSSQPCLDELEVFSGGKNVALASNGTVATASGSLMGYPIHKLEHLNDGQHGNDRSWISSENGMGWVMLEFAEPQRIDRIVWGRDRTERFADRLAIDYVIEAAESPGAWKEIATSATREPFSGETQVPTTRYEFANFPEPEATEGREWLTELQSAKARRDQLAAAPTAFVGTFSQPGPTHRLYRGDPMAKREEVEPNALEVIGSLGLETDAAEQKRRVALAEWIASPDNPLTARVMVNRIWQYQFGTGIVDTPNDFGGNGVPPSHPELLDWLAGEFIASGWSVKHIQRLLLTSHAWQQSGSARPEAMKVDASSRFLWRFPPRRLEAEAIRDSILAATGALDPRMGGPGFSAFEIEPENVRHYFPKKEFGPGDWRRMVYMTKVRQEQDATFGAFDCPDGNQTVPKRSRSTTPLQALNLFNSNFVTQQADILAERLRAEKGDDAAAQIDRAFWLAFGRAPEPAEAEEAQRFAAEQGLEAFCRALLNANEFLFVM